MHRETIQLLRKRAAILIGFIALSLVPAIRYLVLLNTWEISGIEGITKAISSNNVDTADLWISLFVIIVNIVVLLPAFINYIYEYIEGRVSYRWFRKGVDKSWWKLLIICIPILALIYFAGSLIESYEVFEIFPMQKCIQYSLFVMLTCVVAVPVVIENKMYDGLAGIVKIGFKYYHKMLLWYLLFFIMNVLLIIISTMVYINRLGGISLVTIICNTLSTAFLYTQSIQYYLKIRRRNRLKIVRT